jgi:hypothetical protein
MALEFRRQIPELVVQINTGISIKISDFEPILGLLLQKIERHHRLKV